MYTHEAGLARETSLPAALADPRADGPGIYTLYRAGQRLYVGRSANLRRRLQQHLWCLTHLGVGTEPYRVKLTPMRGASPAQLQRVESAVIQRYGRRAHGGALHNVKARELEQELFEGGAAPLVYASSAAEPFGPTWKARRPPGLSASARPASVRGAATPHIERLARALFLGETFVATVAHLALTESGARYALPAIRFDARPASERPAGKPLITAWGAFQFNRDAWRALPGVAGTAFPWDSSPDEEIARPVARYARLHLDVVRAGGTPFDAARGIRLWHRSPAAFAAYLRDGRAHGFPAAWRRVEARHRESTDRHLRHAGIAPASELPTS